MAGSVVRVPAGRRGLNRLVLCALVSAIVLPITAARAYAADRSATPSSFASVWSQAQGGDRILLASGNYGEFAGGSKASVVTIVAQAGASATMSLSFNGASNIRVDSVTIPKLDFEGTTHDVTVANSRFTGGAVVRADEMDNADIVFDHNTHANINVCSNCYEGRMEVTGGDQPSGVTIENSTFGPGGDADGVQIGARGVHVLDNEFTGIQQIDAVHTDSLQLYGSSDTVIAGNYFHGFTTAIMAPDGGQDEQITDNVFISDGAYRPAIQLGTHHGTLFAHNVTRNLDTYVDAKSGAPAGTNNVMRDNIILDGQIKTSTAECSNCTVAYNLFNQAAQASGTNIVVGTPVFVGGASPTSWAGYALAAGSPGKGNASDGTDRGIRTGAGPTPTPSPTPSPTPTVSPTPTPTATPTDHPARAVWTAPSNATVGVPVTLDGTRSTGDGTLSCTWSFENQDASTVWETATGCKITKTFANADTKYVRLTVTDADGDNDQNLQSFAVTAASPTPTPTPTPTPSPTATPTPSPTATPTPSPTPTPTPTPTPPPDHPAHAVWTAPTNAQIGVPVTLDGTRSTGDGTLTCTWSFEDQTGSLVFETASGCRISKAFLTPGTKWVRLSVRDADGDTSSNRQSFDVGLGIPTPTAPVTPLTPTTGTPTPAPPSGQGTGAPKTSTSTGGNRSKTSGTATALISSYGADDGSLPGSGVAIHGARSTRTAKDGSALAFDGRHSTVVLDAPKRGSALTFEAWVRPTSRTAWRGITRLIARAPRVGRALKLRHWSYLAIAYDGRRMRVYVNGKLVATIRTTTGPARHGRLTIGSAGAGRRFRGQIDEMRLYARSLARSDIRSDMSSPV